MVEIRRDFRGTEFLGRAIEGTRRSRLSVRIPEDRIEEVQRVLREEAPALVFALSERR